MAGNAGFDAPRLIGKPVRADGGEVGRIISFIMGPSGQIKDVLIEKGGSLERHPAEMLQVNGEDVYLLSPIEKRLTSLSEDLPKIKKRKEVLKDLSERNVVPSEIIESLAKRIDERLKRLEDEARDLMDEIEREAEMREDNIKSLQMARAFLEIEHAMGTIDEETYKQSIVSLLKEMKNEQQKRLEILRIKERINSILEGEIEAPVEEEAEEGPQPVEEEGSEGAEEEPIPVSAIPE